ncbi:HNH endonuclease [Cardiobacteriaceae bacterium TAE3-ERU3]|nr:HNH endonuclease [Cardiobacteriaceae bacterium TAE3-ERU3]
MTESLAIDPYLFDEQFSAFKVFVEYESRMRFTSFISNPFINHHEGYKYEIYQTAREKLALEKWHEQDIGSGKIVACTIAAIELKNNNFFDLHGKYGPESRLHHKLYLAQETQEDVAEIERCLFNIYYGTNEGASFDHAISIFGQKYPFLAYLFFLKDCSLYLPVKPTFFEQAFSSLGVDLKLSGRCSWENYSRYLEVMDELRLLLSDKLSCSVTLLDAHSFAWMLNTQVTVEPAQTTDVEVYGETERESLIKARKGQGKFRDELKKYWSNACAVTGCQAVDLLRASHIKPWCASDNTE